MNTLSIQSKFGLFQFGKWKKILLLTVASYLMFATVGCGSGFAMPTGGLNASPNAVNFGDVPVNQEVDGSVLVSNSSSVPLTISKMNITGGAFSIQGKSDLPVSIPAGSSRLVKVGFTPAATTDYSGQLTVMDPSAMPMAQIPLRGHGSSQGSAQLTLSDTTLGFGSVVVNSSTTRSLTLKSTGSLPLTVTSAAVSGAGFAIVGGSLPATLNPGQSETLQVRFKPTVAGAAAGKITVGSNSTSGGTTVVALSGTGAATTNPQLTVSATSLAFGNVTANTAKVLFLTLTSTGTSALTVNSAAITGTGFTLVGGSLPATLNPGQSETLQVRFKPTVAGAAAGKITIGSNSTNGSFTTINLSGAEAAATNPQLTVSATSLDFGSVVVNSSTTRSLTLTSTGTSALTVNSAAITGAGFTIIGGSLPATLNPQQSVTLQMQFKPIAAGVTAGKITVGSNSTSGGTTVVALSGTGAAATNPQLTVSASNLAFGNVTVNTAKALTLVLTSTGSSAVTVNSASITGAGFTIVSGGLPATLNPQQSVTLQVQFKPTAAGAATGNITVGSNSTSGGTTVVALSGTGVAATNPQLTVSATSLAFGNVTVNTAKALSLTLTSTGTSAVTVNSAAVTGTGFTIVGGSLPATLNPQQSVTLQVQFKPTAAGAATGNITVGSNSTSGGTTVVALSGTGATATDPQLTVSPTSLAFGNVTANTAKALSLVLTSTGTSALTVNSAAITGTGFTIVSGTLPVTLNPQQSVTLQVQFKPTAAGAATGNITVGSNSTSGGTTVIALSGTGVAATNPQLTVSATSLAFGNVTVNTAKVLSLALTSTGTSAVTVNSAAITGTGFTIVSGTLPATLNPQQSVTLQVQFKPTAAGAATGKITVGSNSTNGGTTIVALSGTGAAATNPQLTVSPTSLAFGSVTVNTATIQTLALQSTGTSAVTVNSAAIAGAGFTIVSQTFPVTLNPQQSITVQVQFKPTATGTASGQITVSSDSTSGGTTVVALSGTGAAANPQLTVSSTSLSFGSLAINTGTTLSVTLKSTGTTPVTVNSAAITGAGFSTVGGSFPVTLNPSGTTTVQVQFKPTTAGAATGKLTISSNSGSGGTVAVSLSGTGTSTAHQVDLSWTAASSTPDPVKGYNIYRSTGSGAMTLMNASIDTATSYVDSTVASGTSYNYVVKSVDSSGVESVGSNQIQLAVP